MEFHRGVVARTVVESGVDLTLVAVTANTVKVLEAVERLEAGSRGAH
jgi:hypothetical protein